jgi:hypothetical protein
MTAGAVEPGGSSAPARHLGTGVPARRETYSFDKRQPPQALQWALSQSCADRCASAYASISGERADSSSMMLIGRSRPSRARRAPTPCLRHQSTPRCSRSASKPANSMRSSGEMGDGAAMEAPFHARPVLPAAGASPRCSILAQPSNVRKLAFIIDFPLVLPSSEREKRASAFENRIPGRARVAHLTQSADPRHWLSGMHGTGWLPGWPVPCLSRCAA